MRIFVTGGAGFIGSNFIRYVLRTQSDVRITNFDKLTYAGNLQNLRDVADHDRYTFIRGDICDREALERALPGHDAVVNLAAETHVDRSITASHAFVMANVVGANTLFDAARRVAIPRFLHMSTDEVYGSIEPPGRFREGDPIEPSSPYAATKGAADLLARSYGVTYDYPITVMRSTNNFGPNQLPEKVIPLFVTSLIDGSRVPVYGDGKNSRDWIYVLDNVRAQWLVLTEGQPGAVYNVSAGNEMANTELAYRILAGLGIMEAAADPLIQYVADRAGHDRRYSVDSSATRALGWQPQHSFEDALAATIEWYRNNEWWWRPLKEQGATRRQGLLD